MAERLQAGATTRDIANSFLVCVSNRFDKFAPPDFHTHPMVTNENAEQIYENIRRVGQNLSRRMLVPTHNRLDTGAS